MSKMSELQVVVEELRAAAASIRDAADSLAEFFSSNEPEETAPAVETPAAPKKVFTLEQVRAVLAEKSHEGLTAEVRALLLKYGAPKLSEIDPKNYEALMADAEVLTHASN